MLFNSVDFLLFLPVTILIYYILPGKVRYIWLLLASYYFYMNWNPQYAILILLSTLITYGCGLFLDGINSSNKGDKEKQRLRKACLAASFIINLGILIYFKYMDFMIDNINQISSNLGLNINISGLDILLPVGISFYTFQALGYTVDVYRGEVAAEKNVLRYALFVSFFPQLVAGPIERTANLMGQLKEKHKLTYDNFRVGIWWMLWGYVIWGALNGLYQIIGDAFSSARNFVVEKTKIDRRACSHRLLKTVVTFALVDFSWIFFRAKTISDSMLVIKSMFDSTRCFNFARLFDGSFYDLGIGESEFRYMLVMILVLLLVDCLKYIKIDIVEKIFAQGYWFRCLIFVCLFWLVFMTGIYGVEYDASQFIYFQF